jgi:hypothetical protein
VLDFLVLSDHDDVCSSRSMPPSLPALYLPYMISMHA